MQTIETGSDSNGDEKTKEIRPEKIMFPVTFLQNLSRQIGIYLFLKPIFSESQKPRQVMKTSTFEAMLFQNF